MTLLPIVTGEKNPILRRKTRKVPTITKEIKKLLKDMEETTVAQDGLGLAAPQVGSNHRLCLSRINGRLIALINPDITFQSDTFDVAEEGCLSLPDLYLQIPRSSTIVVSYLNERGQAEERRLSGLDARTVQHEVDHLNGRLIVDYVPAATSSRTLQPH